MACPYPPAAALVERGEGEREGEGGGRNGKSRRDLEKKHHDCVYYTCACIKHVNHVHVLHY